MPHRLAFAAVFGRAATRLRCFAWVAFASVAALAPLGATSCGGEPAKAPAILRPIDEPHAVAVMARVFREFGLDPVRNRGFQFGAEGAGLTLDVAAKRRRFGIAYITRQDADKLGDAMPRRLDPALDAILILHGAGPDEDAHAAVLFAADYMQDDLSGDQQTSTSIAAEQRLELATRDILRRAERENWP